MKGGCAAILAACDSLIQEGRELPADLAFVCDEEAGGDHGIRHLIRENLLFPCDCLIAEPTPVRHPCIGQKGLCRFTVDFTGTPGHGSLYPVVGVNAIMEAMGLLSYANSLHDRRFPVNGDLKNLVDASARVFSEEFHIADGGRILERITFNPGVIEGGEKVNIIARHCSLGLEMRIPWGCNIPELVGDIRKHVLNGTVNVDTTSDPTLTDPTGDFTAIVCREVERAWGGVVFPILQWAASDARHLRRAGFNVIEYGPGELSTLHGIDERVSIASLEKAVRIYRGILDAYLPKKEAS